MVVNGDERYSRVHYWGTEEKIGKLRRNRLGECTAVKRRVQKLCGSSTWFKAETTPEKESKVTHFSKRAPRFQVGGQKPTESVLFIPYTENSELKKILQEAECHLAGYGSVRYVETTGRTMERSVVTKDPWAGSCLREDCFPCTSGRVGQCMKQNVTYRIDCQICKASGKETTYFGESARTMYDRGQEHLSALNSRDPNSVLVQHLEEHHSDMEPEFAMKLVKTHQSPLYRQVHEGVLIDSFKGQVTLNRKGEWGSNVPCTLEVVDRNGEVIIGGKRNRDRTIEGG